ncbi:MAG: LacI family DNA-binding transcriptional regulator [Erysipelotrichaceae bacterium]
MKQKVTIEDIAKMCSVSKSSVSRYLNQGYVSKEHREIIKKAIETTGYQTNFFAKRLKMKRHYLIGIILHQIHDDRSARILKGIQTVLTKRGYQFVIQIADPLLDQELALIQNLYQQGVDGYILDFKEIKPQHIACLEQLKSPYILLKGNDEHSVSIDEQKAGMILGDLFARGGHESIVYVGMQKDKVMDDLRCQGIKDAYLSMKRKCKLNQEEVMEMEDTYLYAGRFLNYLPSVILLSNELLALGIIRYLHENEIEVPQSVSLASFGGDRIAMMLYPKLTCIAYDYEKQGVIAAEKLIDVLEDEEKEAFQEITCSIVYGESIRAL